MNNEFIASIAGFVTNVVVSVFASITINLLLKHTTRNSGLKNRETKYDKRRMCTRIGC